jgi:hypothetical protein
MCKYERKEYGEKVMCDHPEAGPCEECILKDGEECVLEVD